MEIFSTHNSHPEASAAAKGMGPDYTIWIDLSGPKPAWHVVKKFSATRKPINLDDLLGVDYGPYKAASPTDAPGL